MVLMFVSLLFFSLAFAAEGNSLGGNSDNSNSILTGAENSNKESSSAAKTYCLESSYKYANGECTFKDQTKCDAESFYNGDCGKDKEVYKSNKQRKKESTENTKVNAIKEKNKLKVNKDSSECPEKCTCTGSTMKCELENGREMTVTAGKSGNIIIQTKESNVSTNVELYKAEDGKLYRVTKNNETKEVKYFPDQIKERIKEKVTSKIQNEEIELDENGVYQVQAKKSAKFFGLFPVKEKVQWEVNSETGEITKTKTTWWGFLAADEKELLVGASCGTVTPGENDACCVDKGFTTWNAEKAQCEVQ